MMTTVVVFGGTGFLGLLATSWCSSRLSLLIRVSEGSAYWWNGYYERIGYYWCRL